jgi:hypothetical protein
VGGELGPSEAHWKISLIGLSPFSRTSNPEAGGGPVGDTFLGSLAPESARAPKTAGHYGYVSRPSGPR